MILDEQHRAPTDHREHRLLRPGLVIIGGSSIVGVEIAKTGPRSGCRFAADLAPMPSTMPWNHREAEPVPWPRSLVVKKGSKILESTQGSCPPRCRSPRGTPAHPRTVPRVGLDGKARRPPSGIASRAFRTRFITACWKQDLVPSTQGPRPGSRVIATSMEGGITVAMSVAVSSTRASDRHRPPVEGRPVRQRQEANERSRSPARTLLRSARGNLSGRIGTDLEPRLFG